MEEKRRRLPFKQRELRGSLQHTTLSKSWGITTSGKTSGAVQLGALTGKQVTASENHPGWKTRKGNTADIGGEFFSQRSYAMGTFSPQGFRGFQDTGALEINWIYQGPVLPWNLQAIEWPPAIESDESRLNSLGAEAIAKCKPTNSPADLSVALAELFREGLPRAIGATFWKDKTRDARNAGDEFLNVEFGWKPLVNDILDTAKAVARSGDIAKQYYRDAGKVVRRGYDFPIETDVEESLYMENVWVHCVPSGYNMYKTTSPTGKVRRIRESVTRRWFRGAFSYYLPDQTVGSIWNLAAEAKHVFGLSLTPDTVWNLMPWSWAIDWVTNTGDVISNITDFATDGLVMHYGYIMEHTVTTDTYVWEGDTGLRFGSASPSSVVLVTETKLRKKANPFGFGVTWEGLTDRQNAILAALGLSRSK